MVTFALTGTCRCLYRDRHQLRAGFALWVDHRAWVLLWLHCSLTWKYFGKLQSIQHEHDKSIYWGKNVSWSHVHFGNCFAENHLLFKISVSVLKGSISLSLMKATTVSVHNNWSALFQMYSNLPTSFPGFLATFAKICHRFDVNDNLRLSPD